MKCSRWGILVAISMFMIAVAAQAQIETSFFGMGAVDSIDMPKVPYGILSHPPLAWTAIEGTGRGVYDFSSTDAFVEAAPKDAHGVAQVDLVFGWTPGWAVTSQTHCLTQNSGVVICTSAPDNMQDWADFITQVHEHYNGVTAPHIKYYEIWNEANTTSFWTGSVTSLVSMAKIAYPILKQDKYSSVLTPSVVWDSGVTFLTTYLGKGGSKYADGLSFHGYPSKTSVFLKTQIPLPESAGSSNAPIQNMVEAFRVMADGNGMKGKPLVTTEGGWGVNGVTDPDMQDAWIAQYEIVQAGLAATNDLQFVTWFTWGHASSGTIETAQGQPTAAGLAYQEVTTWLVGTTPSPCTSKGNIWSCAVGKNLIVWDASQTCSKGVCTTGSYTPPAGFEKYVELTGTIESISGTIQLGVKPMLMEP